MSAPDLKAIGERIRAARERLSRNKNEMARDLGTTWQQVNRWERGLTAPGLGSLQKLARYLGVSIDWLLTGDEVRGEPPAARAFREFREHYAPRDLTELEIAWLQAAPFADHIPGPGDYVNMLHQLRTGAMAPLGEERPAAPPRSGTREKVDRDAVERRIRERKKER